MARRKKQDEDQPNDNANNGNESDDTFGLPEIEYEPINREETSDTSETASETYQTSETESSYQSEEPVHDDEPSQYTYMYNEEEEKPVWPRVLLIVLFILAAGGGAAWYFLRYKPKKAQELLAQQELAAQQEAERKERARLDSIAGVAREREQRLADSIANAQLSREGVIEMLEGRTGRYHVVIASAIDDDLLMDYARKLSQRGVSSKIIPPFGNVKFYRLAVADGDTFASAQTVADGLKGEYGEGVWVLRY